MMSRNSLQTGPCVYLGVNDKLSQRVLWSTLRDYLCTGHSPSHLATGLAL